jgi:GntR family transcriptional regulator, transcriptional repressor for pyruvate dehydrogenase complex
MSGIGQVRRMSISESVGERLAALILDGTFKPGDRLPPEHELMRRFHVGRSSVREAVRGLVMVGVLDARPGRGTVVLSPVQNRLGADLHAALGASALQDLFEVRLLLEEHAIGRAARVATEEELDEIDRLAAAVEARVAAGQSYFDANTAFHLAIAKASHNKVLEHGLTGIIGNLKELREHVVRVQKDMPERDLVEHREMIRALRARDAARGRRMVRRHLGYYLK